MDADDEQPEVPDMSTEEPITSDVAEDPATPEENENIPVTENSGESSSASKMAMAEFIRASSEQLEGCEFSLLVVLQPDNVRHRVTVTAESTIGMLRKMLCTDLQLNSELVSFPDLHGLRDTDQNEDNLPLSVYGLPGGNAECTLEAYVARPPTTSDYIMPDRIQVQVYNARHNMGPARFHRETQTQQLVTRSLQTHRESGTQMSRRDLKLDESFDRHRLWRGFRARLYVFSIREQRRRVNTLAEIEAQENEAEDMSRQRREVSRRMHPNTVNDFEVLYNELEKWRQVECRKVREQRELDPSERQRALDAILSKETKLLQTIDRLKLTATEANRKQRIEAMLQFMARPKQWQMSDGGVKEVHTPFTVRAKELMDLYHGLRIPLSSVDERLDMLLHIKWTVQEFDCALTRELVELIDREADMLSRGRKEKSLEGLRKRLTNLFLQFIETPEFNPEAAALKHARANQ
ncbi:hypothetical protein JG687_00015586 [Phytophthora cactorum]|uniref:IQ motif and ubiquitin-like domain-containing protein n=1 Tax=Phytophthora cactorum TaxID=29920 RepID=A0A8T1TYF4_9STRA|nr:hypothetical protein JG687_00015586 [Phytophthora cactorum]